MPAAPRADSQVAPIWNVPYHRNPHFLGRDEDLNELHISLGSPEPAKRVQSIHGLGGIGKTQMAVEFRVPASRATTKSSGGCRRTNPRRSRWRSRSSVASLACVSPKARSSTTCGITCAACSARATTGC
jgi:hypothetical protein